MSTAPLDPLNPLAMLFPGTPTAEAAEPVPEPESGWGFLSS